MTNPAIANPEGVGKDIAGSFGAYDMDKPGAATGVVAGVLPGASTVMNARVPAALYCYKPPNVGAVPFEFNPEKVTMSRGSALARSTKPTPPPFRAGTAGTHQPTTALTGSKIKLSKLTFTGLTTKFLCDQLLAWMIPNLSFGAMFGKGGFSSQPAVLMFQWGPPWAAFMYDCKLTNCSVDYVRFNTVGMPLRAEVNLELTEIPSKLGSMPTNPTSGGLAGRRTHVVGHGESLQSIAQDKYGTPGLWRRIAEVNGLTDPTKIRPGQQLYLPNEGELTGTIR